MNGASKGVRTNEPTNTEKVQLRMASTEIESKNKICGKPMQNPNPNSNGKDKKNAKRWIYVCRGSTCAFCVYYGTCARARNLPRFKSTYAHGKWQRESERETRFLWLKWFDIEVKSVVCLLFYD